MDVASLIASFATGTYTVTRRTRGKLKYGVVQDGTSSTFDVVASVSPASGKDLQKLPEGRRVSETRTVFTATELYTGGQVGEEQGTHLADYILIDNKTFQVEHVETWRDSASGDVGYRCLVARVDGA